MEGTYGGQRLDQSLDLAPWQHLKISVKVGAVTSRTTAAKSVVSKPTMSKSSKPAQTQERIVHVVKKGEILYSIAREYGTDVATIVKENKIDDPASVGVDRCIEISVTSKTPASASTYTVQKGDTVWSISRRFQMPTSVLLGRNNLKKNAVLHVGDVLNIDRY